MIRPALDIAATMILLGLLLLGGSFVLALSMLKSLTSYVWRRGVILVCDVCAEPCDCEENRDSQTCMCTRDWNRVVLPERQKAARGEPK